MKRGFYTLMSAQFFSSLADQALFVAAVELIKSGGGAEWQRAALVPIFALFYVILAPWLGAFADARPKRNVMFVSNAIKVVGCLLMLFGGHPLIGEHPVAMCRFLARGAIVQLADVEPDAQRLALAVGNQRRVIFPCAERIFRIRAARLIHERA